MIFFPVDLAIALTGVVHFFNNIFKLVLVGRAADRQVVLRFGIPAVLAAVRKNFSGVPGKVFRFCFAYHFCKHGFNSLFQQATIRQG